MAHIQVIIGSTRPGRAGKAIGEWFFKQLDEKKYNATFELVDLADFNLPLLDESNLPAMQKYSQDHTKKWAEKIAQADGYIIVTPEYNHSMPAALKNSIDYLFMEWKYKPMAYVSYGAVGGIRAVEQLINTAVGVSAFPLRDQLHIYEPWAALDEQGDVKPENIKGNLEAVVGGVVTVADGTKGLRK